MNEKDLVYIGLGSNLGDSVSLIKDARARIGKLPKTRLAHQSFLYRTAPIDVEGEEFVNAAVAIFTELTPQELLSELMEIEKDFRRERPHPKAARTLDLDILLFGEQIIDTEDLKVPHPRMTKRAFALIPVLQINPFISIPGKGPAHTFVPDVAGQFIQRIK